VIRYLKKNLYRVCFLGFGVCFKIILEFTVNRVIIFSDLRNSPVSLVISHFPKIEEVALTFLQVLCIFLE